MSWERGLQAMGLYLWCLFLCEGHDERVHVGALCFWGVGEVGFRTPTS